jgi:hypothetical protein
MINKIAGAILITLLFALIGIAQGEGTNKPSKIAVDKIKPIKPVAGKPPKTTVIKQQTPKPSPAIPTVVGKPSPSSNKFSDILWTDNCDPRTDTEHCSLTTREDVINGFYDIVKSVNAKITYKIPNSTEELAKYKVVIVRFCSDDNNEETLVNLIKEYLQSGGSAFILGGNTCQSGGHPTSWWATRLTKDFGVTFGSEDDYKSVWADATVGNHPTTLKLKKIYFSQHSNLNVSAPSESTLTVSGEPIAAVYSGTGTFVALSDDTEFGWAPPAYQKLGQNDNFSFWRNSLRWLISQSKINKSKADSGNGSDTSAGLTVFVNQEDVEIFINDEQYDVRFLKSPFIYDSLSPGIYTVRVEKAGFKTEIRTLTLKHKQTLSVNIDLIPIEIR